MDQGQGPGGEVAASHRGQTNAAGLILRGTKGTLGPKDMKRRGSEEIRLPGQGVREN